MWFTSDLHFGHQNIITYCDRPFHTVAHMNETMIANWNAQVAPDDVVHILGDVCMGHLVDTIPLIERLHGVKILTPGNHDPIWSGAPPKRREKWDAMFRGAFQIIQPETWFGMALDDNPIPVMVSHFPYVGHDHRDHDDFRPIDKGHWLLHGHTHGLWRQRGRMIDVGIDAWGGRLVHVDEINELIADGPQDLDPISWRAVART